MCLVSHIVVLCVLYNHRVVVQYIAKHRLNMPDICEILPPSSSYSWLFYYKVTAERFKTLYRKDSGESGWSQREETETYSQKHRRYSGQSKWREATEQWRRAQWTDRQKDRTSLPHSRGRGNKQRLQREWDTVSQSLESQKKQQIYLQKEPMCCVLHSLCVCSR